VILVLCVLGIGMGSWFLGSKTPDASSDPVLYLVHQDPNGLRLVAVDGDTVCEEPNLVIITHGWYEREAWPAEMALAISERVDRQFWRCGWYDWRGPAGRLRPSDAAKIARDDAGPMLGRQIVRLSNQWRHVHLIGHSAGSWLVNEAAGVVAEQTSASIHLTFLDAYVPQGWDQKLLGRFAGDPCETCWADHYFTRDPFNLTENVLAWACNVDVTDVNPGFRGHKFPWRWYQATIVSRYDPAGRFAPKRLCDESDGVRYGYARSREAGSQNWQASMALKVPREPVIVADPG
jgi:hypothetical protein